MSNRQPNDAGGSFDVPHVFPDGTTEDEALAHVPPEELAFAQRRWLQRLLDGDKTLIAQLTPEQRALYEELINED